MSVDATVIFLMGFVSGLFAGLALAMEKWIRMDRAPRINVPPGSGGLVITQFRRLEIEKDNPGGLDEEEGENGFNHR